MLGKLKCKKRAGTNGQLAKIVNCHTASANTKYRGKCLSTSKSGKN